MRLNVIAFIQCIKLSEFLQFAKYIEVIKKKYLQTQVAQKYDYEQKCFTNLNLPYFSSFFCFL